MAGANEANQFVSSQTRIYLDMKGVLLTPHSVFCPGQELLIRGCLTAAHLQGSKLSTVL